MALKLSSRSMPRRSIRGAVWVGGHNTAKVRLGGVTDERRPAPDKVWLSIHGPSRARLRPWLPPRPIPTSICFDVTHWHSRQGETCKQGSRVVTHRTTAPGTGHGGCGGACAVPALSAWHDVGGMVGRNQCPLEPGMLSSVQRQGAFNHVTTCAGRCRRRPHGPRGDRIGYVLCIAQVYNHLFPDRLA